jgi:hypothetical protein
LLYEMLTGTWPFQGKTAVEVRHAVLQRRAGALVEDEAGRDAGALARRLDKALAKDPRESLSKDYHFANDLREIIRELGTDSLPGIDEARRRCSETFETGRTCHSCASLADGRKAAEARRVRNRWDAVLTLSRIR